MDISTEDRMAIAFGGRSPRLLNIQRRQNPVWVELPEAFYFSPLGRMSLVWFAVT